ncbi:MAG: glycosyltransferase [Candidatus Moranbacteria bacterium]|nr:glycosyltransferase [Candidatus Moranbacteria bacterium]
MPKSNKKNILMVTRPIYPPWDEASKNFAWALVNRLRYFNFHLLTYKKLKNLDSHLEQHSIYTNPSLRLSFGQKARLLRFLAFPPQPIQLMHFLFTPSPQTTNLIRLLKLFGRFGQAKTIQTLATLDFQKVNQNNIKSFIFADQVVTYSHHTRKFLKDLNLNNVKTIYPGVDQTKFYPAKKNPELEREFKIKPKQKIILYTGEYHRLQASDTIAQSLVKLKTVFPDFKMIFACRIKSDHDYKKQHQLKRFFKQKNLDSQIMYLETFKKMRQLYNLADLFIFPVKQMTGKFDIALTVIEAMACGLPCIISDIKPLNEVFQQKNCALALKPINSYNLFTAMHSILANPALAQSLSRNALLNIQKNFSFRQCSRQYQALYQTCLE